MAHMLSLLNEMRGRVGMYVGSPSIIRVAAFLRGYEHAVSKFEPGGTDRLLTDFRDWIHKQFRSSEHSWEETILRNSAGEADAFKRFWELLDEYLAERKVAPPPTPVPANSLSPSAPSMAS